MALSGSVETSSYTFDNGTTRTVVLSWTATQNIVANTSTISWALKGGGTSNAYKWVMVSELRVKIDGKEVFYRSESNHTDCYIDTLLASGTVTVSHGSDGKKDVAMSVEAGIYNWAINKSGSKTFTLNQIDRAAPTVTCDTSNITSAGFKISATSNVTADIWQYSLDDGSTWTQFSATAGTSASKTLSNLSPNTTYNVKVRARKKSNQVYGTSARKATKTLGASVINSATSFAGDVDSPALKYNLTVYDAGYYHKIAFKNGSTEIFSAKLGKLTAGTTDRTFSLTSSQRTSLLKAFPSATSLSATVVITTYSDSGYSTQIGSASSKAVSVTTSSARSAPTFNVFTYEDTKSAVVKVTGTDQVLVKGLSSLRVICDAGKANNGASIKSYSASIGNASKTSTTTTINVGAISKYGTLTLSVSCTDSRGYSTTVTQKVTVLNYANPKLSSFTLRRKNEIEGLIQLSFGGTISAIKADGSTNTNELTNVRYRYKKTTDEDYGSYVSILSDVTTSGTSFSFSSLELLELDAECSYNFQLQIRDAFGSTTSLDVEAIIPQGTPVVSLRKRNSSYSYPRVGINNPAPKHALDVSGSVAMNGFLVMGYVQDLTTENFNTLKEGIYYYPGSGCSNAPTSAAGFLEAITNGTAILHRFTTLSGAVYHRGYDGSAWSAWA